MNTGNTDAAALLADTDLQGERTQDALGTLTDALADADYLTDADNTLLVTTCKTTISRSSCASCASMACVTIRFSQSRNALRGSV